MALRDSDVQPDRADEDLGRRQRVVLLAPLVLIAVMLGVFQLSRALFGEAAGGRRAWFAGMAFYWVVWGGLFPVWALGRRRCLELLAPGRPTRELVAHVAFLVAMAAVVRFAVPGMAYEKPTVEALVLLAISPFANGLFEELLWRGVYLDVFGHSAWIRVVWASVWFGLWHLAPGSIAADGPNLGMVIGPVLMGLYLAFLARKTGSVWWPMIAHTLGGLVMIS